VAVVLAALVVAGAGYAVFAFQSSGGPAPVSLGAATPSAAASGSGDPGGTSGTWSVQTSGSFVGYRVREKLAFLPAPSDAVGRTSAVTGTMTVAGRTIEAVAVQADLSKLTSNEARRDQRMQTMGLETDTFPTATFRLSTPIVLDAKPKRGEVVKTTATGAFTLHGVTRTITIPVQARWDGATIEVVSSFPVRFSDYAIQAPNFAGFVSVQDSGTVELELVFAKSA